MNRVVKIVALLVVAGIHAAPLHAQTERILDFHSDITVNPDSSLDLTETIRVHAAGDEIKRGIYRDFPTIYPSGNGQLYQVGFEVLGIERDGKKEDYHVENQSNGVRIYIGNKDVFLSPGPYTYAIHYKTTCQLGYFEDHDELYWNVTGNGWVFPIDNASATVHLPYDVPLDQVKMIGYTGPQGSRDSSMTHALPKGSAIEFQTSARLGSHEGLTIAVSFPKGHVQEVPRTVYTPPPPPPNRDFLLWIAVVFLLGFYLLTWWNVGKDPDKGTIIPLYYPPKDFSADTVRYLSRMGYDNKSFTCMVINLAVKGAIKIEDKRTKLGPLSFGGSYTLVKETPKEALTKLEKDFLDELLPGEQASLELDNKNHARIQSAISEHQRRVKKAVDKVYYLSNMGYFTGGIGISLLIFAMTMVCMPNFSVPYVVATWVILVILNVIFYNLLKAPTTAGRAALDKIEGFKMFLSATEKEQLKWLDVPQKTPQLYEAYLPYAIALDVEDKWSRQFTAILAAAVAAGYAPTWYSGNQFHSRRFADDLGGTFSNAIAAASTPPGSSSGFGGGGGSGGGGGGGGGGGW